MIQEFVDNYMRNKKAIEDRFAAAHPESYDDVVGAVMEAINPDKEYNLPDPERIHRIDDGHWQGTLLYVIAAIGYQPHDYWAVKVYYGSCSGCDTLEALRGYSDEKPTPDQVAGYMTLALHIVQGLIALQ